MSVRYSMAAVYLQNMFSLSHLLLSTSENDITGVLDHTFCVEHNAYGEIIQHELKPNGKSIPVTEENKKEYVRYINICSKVFYIFYGGEELLLTEVTDSVMLLGFFLSGGAWVVFCVFLSVRPFFLAG